MSRRGDKIIEIEVYLEELGEFLPIDFESYMGNKLKRAACERYFEKIVEATIDLTFVVIKEKGFRSPDSDRDALEVLRENSVIPSELAGKLSDAKSMRNIIIHEYGYIDDRLVFNSLKNELISDIEKFLGAVR